MSLEGKSQTWFSQLDSIVAKDGVTYYTLEEGRLNKKKRIGEWKISQFNALDTSKRLAVESTYDNDMLVSTATYRLDSKVEKTFDQKGKPLTEVLYRYGKKVWSRAYKGSKKTIKKTYYPDGSVSSQGEEVLVVITAGCDAGMRMFIEEGVWKYYDTSGELIDEQCKEITKKVFKKV